MDITNVRYLLEHKLLPKWFLEEREAFVVTLIKNENMLYQVMQDICTKEEVELPYEEEQYQIEPFNILEEIKALLLIFPEPERSPLCRRCYLLFDMTHKKYGLYTIEKGEEEDDFLCGWEKQLEGEIHVNYGYAPEKLEDEIERVIGLFLTLYDEAERPVMEEEDDDE